MSFVSRAYNELIVSENKKTIIKYSTNVEKLWDEVHYFQTVPTSIKHYFPTIYNYGFNDQGKSFYEMEYFPHPNAYDIVSKDVLECVLCAWKNIRTLIHNNNSKCKFSTVPMYIDRIFIEVKKLWDQFGSDNILIQSPIVVNNKILNSNIHDLLNNFQSIIKKNNLAPLELIHGDLTLSNIVVSPDLKTIKFIDPRGSFNGKRGIYGDVNYDIAKLYHSYVCSYEDIINDKFELNIDNNCITYDSARNKIQEYENDFWSLIEQYFGLQNKVLIKGIVGAIFLGMCARHYDNKNRQMVFYVKGLELLNGIL